MRQEPKVTQSAAILRHLRRNPSITPLDALRHYGCLRLGARIWDLRQAGHRIGSHRRKVGAGKWVAEYWLAQER
nr:helix-turn-helix domain-containing protein [uncultured Rhodopila sp.]